MIIFVAFALDALFAWRDSMITTEQFLYSMLTIGRIGTGISRISSGTANNKRFLS
jgi:hypothetical protein